MISSLLRPFAIALFKNSHKFVSAISLNVYYCPRLYCIKCIYKNCLSVSTIKRRRERRLKRCWPTAAIVSVVQSPAKLKQACLHSGFDYHFTRSAALTQNNTYTLYFLKMALSLGLSASVERYVFVALDALMTAAQYVQKCTSQTSGLLLFYI